MNPKEEQKVKEWDTFYELTKTMDGQHRPALRKWVEAYSAKMTDDAVKEAFQSAMWVCNDGIILQNPKHQAVEAERERLREAVEKLRAEVLPTHAEENGYGCALDDVLAVLSNNPEEHE